MPFHLPRLTTLNRSSIHRGGSGVEEIFPSDEIHNWFISARETKACWKTIFGIIELPYTFFFPLPFFSRRFFIAIFPFLFVLFFFFFILYFSFAPLRAKVSSARVQRAFFRGNWNREHSTVYEESSRIYHGPRVLRAVCWDRWWVKPRKSETSRAKETILRKCGIISIYAFLRNTRLRTSERNFVWNLNYAQTFA